MNRTLKEATVRPYDHETHDRRRQHLTGFLNARNFAKRHNSLKGLRPFEKVSKWWAQQRKRFNNFPPYHFPGLNIER